jgi:hypothetical protein
MFKADPPDFIDSGSYEVTDVQGLGSKWVGVAVGTLFIGSAIGVGLKYSGKANNSLYNALGIESENGDNGPSITIN